MLNCFLFEKFYLHYALCDFDSILLHYAKLFIRQSIDREQIFDVTFQPLPPTLIWKILRTPLMKISVDFLNWIYFIASEGRQKPDEHYVTKSHKIIVGSPFR